ncbi:diacylglycerol kinase family protein [Kitasatospora cineracea]|uniref:Undecaprenyl-diphosphatase n=1 Tax=Kitasatospora cineracea TaxID=88074 RepID=A0A8G1ULY4_9ACTN|nr:diacylglycerol kinase family protein [Kitasatospora cineracea]ROR46288.1 undecaprenyl-diphosphatase [Kitasatospora cineracea]
MTRTQGRTAPLGVLAAVAGQGTVLVAAGLLVTHPPGGWWDPAEDGLVARLAEHRTAALTTVSSWLSGLAFTPAIVAVTAAVALLLLLRHQPRPAALLAGAVALQAALFVTAAHLVDRARPDVVRLDGALPTSSFPSGHVGAATALYGGLGLLALHRLRGRWRILLCALAWTVPLLVAASRLYRGMHHPTDVLAGALNGAAALWVVARALPARTHRAPAAPAAASPAVPLPVALVYNPVTVDDALLERLCAVLAAHGHRPPRRLPGAAEDSGRAAAERALADGARLVAACGGDGTVTACAEALSGTGATLAVVPCGTGNLLARNLGLPTDPEAALAAALTGRTRRIDLMRAEGDGLPARAAATMAGMGLDAAVMSDTGRALKRRLGWPAYLVAGARHLGDRRFALTVAVDGAEPVHRQVRAAVVGNVGTLQGGVRLLPAAVPDDGRLDLVLVQPHGPRGWGQALLALLTGNRRPGPDAPLEHFPGRRITLTADRAHPRQCDGDPVGEGRTLTLTVRPAALRVRVPAGPAEQPEPIDRPEPVERTERTEQPEPAGQHDRPGRAAVRREVA